MRIRPCGHGDQEVVGEIDPATRPSQLAFLGQPGRIVAGPRMPPARRRRAGLVPARPAGWTTTPRSPRADVCAHGLLRLRFRPRDPRRAARRAPTGASSSSARAWSSSTPRCERLGGGPDRARMRRARDEIPRAGARSWASQAVFANHDYEPRRWRATRRSSARSRPRHRVPARQGPGDLRAGRGADAAAQPFTVFTPYKNAWLAHARRPFYLQGLSGRSATPPRSRRRRAPARCRRSRQIGFDRTQPAAPACRPACSGGAALFERLHRAHRRLSRARATTPPSRARPICRCTCASARSRSASWRAVAHCADGAGDEGAQTWLVGADLARLLLPCPVHHPHVVERTRSSREYDAIAVPGTMPTRCSRPGARAAPAIRWSTRRCGRSTSTGYMHNRLRMVVGLVPGQGPARRLAPGRALLRRAAERLRPRRQQRRLAMGGIDRLRRPALLPDLQPRDAVGAVRSARAVHPPLPAASWRSVPRQRHPRAVDDAAPASSRQRAWCSGATIRRRSSTTTRRARSA